MSDDIDMVIYHGPTCNDGFCAAWLARKAFPDAEFVPAQYGQDPPDVIGRKVLIADFSYKRQPMLQVIGQAEEVAIIDHHKTAEAELDGLIGECDGLAFDRPEVVFDMDASGARLTWLWLVANDYILADRDHPPWLVDYTEDRDLWRFRLPESRAVNAALSSYPMTFAAWDELAERGHAGLIPEGRAILRYQEKVVGDHVRHAREVEIGGHKVLATNATTLFSEIAGKLAEDRPFGAAYFDRADGKRQWSLRSRDGGIDVSEVARAHGGGGHRNAAGFEVDTS